MATSPTRWTRSTARLGALMRKQAPLMILIGLVLLFTFISPNFLTFKDGFNS
jgi:hypothetical protein